jgi:small-conductance mechanosensitive channel
MAAMPPPADFDILPDLHKLLTRLTAPPSLPASTPGPAAKDKDKDGPLEIQQLAAEANAIKRKIQRAREKVMALPDMDRSVEDQQEEIEDLETSISQLKAALRSLGQLQNQEKAAGGDTSMTG